MFQESTPKSLEMLLLDKNKSESARLAQNCQKQFKCDFEGSLVSDIYCKRDFFNSFRASI